MQRVLKKNTFNFLLIISSVILLLLSKYSNASQIDITSVQIDACAVDGNNNLLITGLIVINGVLEAGVARYTPSGILDATFGSSGYVFTSLGSQIQTPAIAVQPADGKIITAGFAVVDSITQVVLVRYNTDGSYDTSFGSNGIVTTQIGDGAAATDVAIQSDGQIVIAGSTIQGGTPEFFVARYNNADGSLDTSFNTSGVSSGIPGIMITLVGFRCSANALAIQSNGEIVVAGTAAVGTQNQFALVRYNANGSYDTTFGTDGMVTTPIGAYAEALSLAIESTGSIVTAGNSDTNVAVIRYNSVDGSIDTTFNSTGLNSGVAGIALTSIGNKSKANALLIDASGNVLIGGFSDSNLLVARYTSAGILDTSFGSKGTGVVTFSIEATNMCNALVFENSDIIAVGYAASDALLVAFTSAGIVNTTWGTNGVIAQPGNADLFTTIWEQESTGTNGGTFTAGIWQTRVLNSITNINNTVGLANNQFTLTPGVYTISVSAPAYLVDNHQALLQNVTEGVTTLYGSSSFSPSTGGSMTTSIIDGQFAVAVPTVFEIQHKCSTTQANDGLGIASGFGAEVYTVVKIINNFSF